MKKKAFLLFATIMLLVCHAAMAQWENIEYSSRIRQYIKHAFQIEGVVMGTDDFEPEPFPLQSANVKVTCLGDTTLFDGASVDKDGRFYVWFYSQKKLKDTRLHISVSYLGMESYESDLNPTRSDEGGLEMYAVELDTIVLKSFPMTPGEVEIVEELTRMYQRGDTIIFNADAYDMPSGSVLLDLVRRLPGLSYKDGKLMYMDRDIQEIKLNGDSFFKRDMTIALNNMPHDKLKSLKVYEELDDTLNVMSDNHLVMDMVTKEPMDHALMGNVEAATTEKFDHYSFEGSLNRWKDEGGEFYSNFSTSDIPYSGDVSVENKRTSGNAYFDYSGSHGFYLGSGANYNSHSNKNRNSSLNRSFMPDYTQTSTSESSSSYRSRNMGGDINVNGSIEKNNASWSTGLSYSQGNSDNGSESVDSISNEGQGLVSATQQRDTSHGTDRNVNLNGSYYQSFGEDDKFNFSVHANAGHSESESTSINCSESRFFQLGDSIRTINHRITNPGSSNSINGGLRLGLNMSENLWGDVSMNASYNESSSVQNYEDILADCTRNVDSLHYDRFNSNLNYSLGSSVMYSDSIIRIQFNGSFAPTVQVDNNDQYGKKEDIRYTGIRWNADASLRLRVRRKSQLEISYRFNNGLPGASQLSGVTDYSDPMNIREGNPDLKNSQSHNGSVSFQFRTYARVSLNAGTTLNEFTTLSIVDRQTGARRTSPANINGSWNAGGRLFLTKDLKDVTLSSTTNCQYRHNVSYVQEMGAASNSVMKSGTDWKNLSTSIDACYGDGTWMFDASAGYSLDNSSSDYLSNPTRGQHVTGTASVHWYSESGLELETRLNYDKPFGYEMASANREQCIWNFDAEYRFLKSKKARATIEWRDILNSYNGFNASMSGTSWYESQTYGETSMIVISLSYRLNDF